MSSMPAFRMDDYRDEPGASARADHHEPDLRLTPDSDAQQRHGRAPRQTNPNASANDADAQPGYEPAAAFDSDRDAFIGLINRAKEERVRLMAVLRQSEDRAAAYVGPPPVEQLQAVRQRVDELDGAIREQMSRLEAVQRGTDDRVARLRDLERAIRDATQRFNTQAEKLEAIESRIEQRQSQVTQAVGQAMDRLDTRAGQCEEDLKCSARSLLTEMLGGLGKAGEALDGKLDDANRTEARLEGYGRMLEQRLAEAGERADQYLAASLARTREEAQRLVEPLRTQLDEQAFAAGEQLQELRGQIENHYGAFADRFDEISQRATARLEQRIDQLAEEMGRVMEPVKADAEQWAEQTREQSADYVKQLKQAAARDLQQHAGRLRLGARAEADALAEALNDGVKRTAAQARDELERELVVEMDAKREALAQWFARHRAALRKKADQLGRYLDRESETMAQQVKAALDEANRALDGTISAQVADVDRRAKSLADSVIERVGQAGVSALDEARRRCETVESELVGKVDEAMRIAQDRAEVCRVSLAERIEATLDQAEIESKGRAERLVEMTALVTDEQQHKLERARADQAEAIATTRAELALACTELSQAVAASLEAVEHRVDAAARSQRQRIASLQSETDRAGDEATSDTRARIEAMDTVVNEAVADAERRIAEAVEAHRQRLGHLQSQAEQAGDEATGRARARGEEVRGLIDQAIGEAEQRAAAAESAQRERLERLRDEAERSVTEATASAESRVDDLRGRLIGALEAALDQAEVEGHATVDRLKRELGERAEVDRETQRVALAELSNALHEHREEIERQRQSLAEAFRVELDRDLSDAGERCRVLGEVFGVSLDEQADAYRRRLEEIKGSLGDQANRILAEVLSSSGEVAHRAERELEDHIAAWRGRVDEAMADVRSELGEQTQRFSQSLAAIEDQAARVGHKRVERVRTELVELDRSLDVAAVAVEEKIAGMIRQGRERMNVLAQREQPRLRRLRASLGTQLARWRVETRQRIEAERAKMVDELGVSAPAIEQELRAVQVRVGERAEAMRGRAKALIEEAEAVGPSIEKRLRAVQAQIGEKVEAVRRQADRLVSDVAQQTEQRLDATVSQAADTQDQGDAQAGTDSDTTPAAAADRSSTAKTAKTSDASEAPDTPGAARRVAPDAKARSRALAVRRRAERPAE